MRAITRRTREGRDANPDFSPVAHVAAGAGHGAGAGVPAQRGGCHHGTLASQLCELGSEPEASGRHGRHRDQAGRFQHRSLPRRRGVFASAADRHAADRRHRRLGREPRRLRRPGRPGVGGQMEGRRRAGGARQQQPARSGLGHDAGWPAHRGAAGQDPGDADPARAHPFLCRGDRDPADAGLVRAALRRQAGHARRWSPTCRARNCGSPRPRRRP